MTTKRSVWEDIDISRVFTRKRLGKLTVLRVQRRSTRASRLAGTFFERYQLQCDCGKKFWLSSSEKMPKNCGKDCKLKQAGPLPEEILLTHVQMVTNQIQGGVYEGKNPRMTCMRIVRAAKAHGWKV